VGLDLYNENLTERIVFRLRITFGIIVFLLGITALIGAGMLYRLKTSQQQAITYSVPKLAESQKLVSFLTTITDQSARLSTASSGDRVMHLSTSLIQHRNELLVLLESESNNSDSGRTLSQQLRKPLNDLEMSLREIIPLKLELVRIEDKFQAEMSGVELIHITLNEIIEPLVSDLAQSVNRTLDSAALRAPFTTSNNRLKQKINQQHRLLELSHRMSALLDIVGQLSSVNTIEQHENLVARLSLRFNNIPQYLLAIEDKESRKKIVTLFEKLRVITVGQSGLLHDLSEHHNLRLQFEELHVDQTRIVEEIAAIADLVVARATKDIDDATTTFDRNLTGIVSTASLVGVALILLVIFVILNVVEKQINRRMSKLTSAVMDIAGGDTEREVGITGSDEIGTMARALEVFKQNARELHRSNKELELFAYAASHDLKSPLKAIQQLAQWTIEDSEDQLSAESMSNLEELLKRSNRLSVLQSDLLEYAQAGRANESVDELNLVEMVDELADHLAPDGKFSITVSKAPTGLYTWITPLRQILLNLINNAIKHHDRGTGCIEVSAFADNERLTVSVIDDGPGIPKQYHNRIFDLFEKLESKDRVEGSGLGLSMVQKMIEQSNGSISIVSDPVSSETDVSGADSSRGCTFTFDWPLATEFIEEHRAVGF